MKDYLRTLSEAFQQNANKLKAQGQKAYMRNQFEFFGMTSPVRREIQKPWLKKENLPDKTKLESIIKNLWLKPQREYQFFAQELVYKYRKQFDKNDITLLEFMVANKSWWDTVDYIAANLIGHYFNLYPEQIEKYISRWLTSGNIWLQRSAILFQLKYKNKVDTDLLTYIVTSQLGSKEFFINKAIGWMLREYGKTNPGWVLKFVNVHQLSALSLKEASRLIKKKPG